MIAALKSPTRDRRRSAGSTPVCGFTLIELLVVIAIIAILAVLVGTASSRAIAQGRRVRCVSNLKQLGYGATLYATDHRDKKPPIHGPWEWTTPNVKFAGRFTGAGHLIDEYLTTHEIVLCPGIDPAQDLKNDRDMWIRSSLVGSSYLYEWHHPFPTWRVRTPEEIARFDETSHLSSDPGYAMVMDLNFELSSQYMGPIVSHRLLGTANVLFADASVGIYPKDRGLVVKKNDKPYNVWMAWEAAHVLRR